MSARFADQAARLAGIAGALLGWRPTEFWAATPEELATILLALTGAGAGNGGETAGADDVARLREIFPDG
jgi:hypothetical protein